MALTILLSGGACTAGPPGASPTMEITWHDVGNGPLDTVDGLPDGVAVDPREGVRWTLGMPLCVLDPAVPATLQSAEATMAVGKFEVLGIKVRTFFGRGDDWPISSVLGFPPIVPDPVTDVAGHVVPNGCKAGDEAPVTELLIGLGVTGPEGGGFQGVDITYSANGALWTLHTNYQVLICGTDVGELC